jgi:hypothetical protein
MDFYFVGGISNSWPGTDMSIWPHRRRKYPQVQSRAPRRKTDARLNSPVLLMIGAGVNERALLADSKKRIEVSVSNYGDIDIENATLS